MSTVPKVLARLSAGIVAGLMSVGLALFGAGVPVSSAMAVAGSWSTPPANLSAAAAGQQGTAPQVSFDAAGNAIAIWTQYDGANYFVQSSTSRDAGVSWSSPVTVSGLWTSINDSMDAQVSFDAAGNAIAIWTGSNGTSFVVESSRSTDHGLHWSTPFAMSDSAYIAEYPQVGFDSLGRAIAIWQSQSGGGPVIEIRTSSNAGLSWSARSPLYGGSAGHAQLGFDAAGKTVAIYTTTAEEQSRTSSDGGANWSTAVPVSASGGNPASQQIAVDAAGNTVAVWNRKPGAKWIVESNWSNDAGLTWSTAQPLSDPLQQAKDPQVARDAAGNVIAVWHSNDGSIEIVQSSTSSDGGANWSTPANLSASGGDAYDPQISFDPAGNAIAVWDRYDSVNSIVESRTSNDAGATWSTPVGLSAAGSDGYLPQVSFDSAGTAIAIWQSDDGSNTIVQSSRFGPPVGPVLAATGLTSLAMGTGVIVAAVLLVVGGCAILLARRRAEASGR